MARIASWWIKLPEYKQKQILKIAKDSIHQAAKYVNKNYNVNYKTAQSQITKQLKKPNLLQGVRELTSEDKLFLERFKKGDIKFDEVQRELASRVIEKILKYPDDISVRDYLQSELIKVKREELNTKSQAMNRFVDSFFGGFAWDKCPHCKKSLDTEPSDTKKLKDYLNEKIEQPFN